MKAKQWIEYITNIVKDNDSSKINRLCQHLAEVDILNNPLDSLMHTSIIDDYHTHTTIDKEQPSIECLKSNLSKLIERSVLNEIWYGRPDSKPVGILNPKLYAECIDSINKFEHETIDKELNKEDIKHAKDSLELYLSGELIRPNDLNDCIRAVLRELKELTNTIESLTYNNSEGAGINP